MAIEMRIYEEVTGIEPKIIAGVTMRQGAAILAMLPFVVPLGVALWMAGHDRAIAYAVIPVALPFLAFGWVRPLGLKLEVYLRDVWTYLVRPGRRVYGNQAVWESQQRASYEGVKPRVPRKQERLDVG